jgi:hypothetical protein
VSPAYLDISPVRIRGLSRSRRAAAAENFTTLPPPKNASRRAAAAADILFGAAEALLSCALFDFVFYVHCSSTADLSQQVVILSFCLANRVYFHL